MEPEEFLNSTPDVTCWVDGTGYGSGSGFGDGTGSGIGDGDGSCK